MDQAPPPANLSPLPTMPQAEKKGFLRFLPWVIVVILVVGIGIAVSFWKPWEAKIPANSRTVEVTGTATLKAAPDEFVFYPTYSFKGADKTKLISDLTAKNNEMVAAIKKLGVADKDIKSDSSGYTSTYYYDSTDGTSNYTLSLTVTVNDKQLAQKVQDYLLTTNPEGSVSPQSSFSTSKEKQLQDQARDQATKDARAKADKSAKNLGFKVGAVKTVVDGDGFSTWGCGPNGLCSGSNLQSAVAASSQSLELQPGENNLDYSVKVTYFIK